MAMSDRDPIGFLHIDRIFGAADQSCPRGSDGHRQSMRRSARRLQSATPGSRHPRLVRGSIARGARSNPAARRPRSARVQEGRSSFGETHETTPHRHGSSRESAWVIAPQKDRNPRMRIIPPRRLSIRRFFPRTDESEESPLLFGARLRPRRGFVQRAFPDPAPVSPFAPRRDLRVRRGSPDPAVPWTEGLLRSPHSSSRSPAGTVRDLLERQIADEHLVRALVCRNLDDPIDDRNRVARDRPHSDSQCVLK